jgi:Flp pilus assembly protein TadD
MKAFETAVRFDAKNSRALMEIGVAMERGGKGKEARSFFERAVKANARNGDAHCYLGMSLNTKERLTKDARGELEKCVGNPNTSEDLKALANDALVGTAGSRR